MIALNTNVTYVNAKGRNKAALVIGTPESIGQETHLTLTENEVFVAVFSLTGQGVYVRKALTSQEAYEEAKDKHEKYAEYLNTYDSHSDYDEEESEYDEDDLSALAAKAKPGENAPEAVARPNGYIVL